MEYDLFKEPIQVETLHIVQYLYSMGIDARPLCIFERNHAAEATELPTIHARETDEWFVGLDECVRFYSRLSGIEDVVVRAAEFKSRAGEFRISDTRFDPL